MYKISVPIVIRSCRRYTPEAMLAEVKKFDAKRVFLALGYYHLDPEKRRADIEDLKKRQDEIWEMTRDILSRLSSIE